MSKVCSTFIRYPSTARIDIGNSRISFTFLVHLWRLCTACVLSFSQSHLIDAFIVMLKSLASHASILCRRTFSPPFDRVLHKRFIRLAEYLEHIYFNPHLTQPHVYRIKFEYISSFFLLTHTSSNSRALNGIYFWFKKQFFPHFAKAFFCWFPYTRSSLFSWY